MGYGSVSCSTAMTNYQKDCVTKAYSAQGLTPVVNNLIQGRCSDHLIQLFFSCVPKLNLVKYQNVCFSSFTSFFNCLPGIHAHQTNNPPFCRALSYITFILNESIAWIDNTYLKAGAFALTQIARIAETETCLPKCYDPSDSFSLVGDHELQIEWDRYAAAGVNYLGRKALERMPYFIQAMANHKVVRAVDIIYFHMMPALSQQGLRNQDMLDVHKKCAPYTYLYREFMHNHIHPITSSRVTTVIIGQILKPLGLLALNLTSMALGHTLQMILKGLSALGRSLLDLSAEALRMVWNNLFAGNALFDFIAQFLTVLQVGTVETLRGIWEGYIFVKGLFSNQVNVNTNLSLSNETESNTSTPKEEKINPFTGKTNEETYKKNPEAKKLFDSIRKKFSLSNAENQLPTANANLAAEEVDKANKQAESKYENVFVAIWEGIGPGGGSC